MIGGGPNAERRDARRACAKRGRASVRGVGARVSGHRVSHRVPPHRLGRRGRGGGARRLRQGLGRASRFRPGAEFKPWLLRIVANEAHNRRRSSTRREALSPPSGRRRDLRGRGPVSGGGDSDGERRQSLVDAVNRLDGRDRDVLACRYFLELSEEETAQVLGVRRGTVKSRTARALERLRVEVDA